MKHSASIVKTILSAIIAFYIGGTLPAVAKGHPFPADSIEVSLLTCAPHDDIYSLYGHTALRVNDRRQGGADLVFSYGVFNFNKPFFALRFTLGKTDYELGVMPYSVFWHEYNLYGRQVTEQVIDLRTEEKLKLMASLLMNYLPENRVYRYNFYYDNCTTRARDMIENAIDGKVIYANKGQSMLSYRKLIHAQLQGHRWAAFADDLCLGLRSDIPIDARQQQFLPERLMDDFCDAEIQDANGRRPLVSQTRIAVPTRTWAAPEDTSMPSPRQVALVLLGLTIVVTMVCGKHKTVARVFDVTMLSIVGLAGIIVLALFFSEHPTTSTNLQVFAINPLPLFFLPSMIKGKETFWRVYIVMLALFFIGGLFQDYAEGMGILALCLLIRCCANLRRTLQNILKRSTAKE